MRAVYIEDIDNSLNETEVKGDGAAHLIRVLRIRTGETILGLDGLGSKYFLEVTKVNRSSVNCKILERKIEKRKEMIDLCIGQTKKDALDLILKEACELGIRKVYILNSEYSQRFPINLERVHKLLRSGIEQSNNPFLPLVEVVGKLSEIDYENFDNILFFSSVRDGGEKGKLTEGKTLFVIGPEGGFSESEEIYFRGLKNCKTFMLNTYILRSPTALSAVTGFYLGLKS